ncbi:MAG: hypothetical protein ABIG20_03460 [archaeon]
MEQLTTIAIEKETRDELKKFGTKDETYDDIIKKMMMALEYESLVEEHYKVLRDDKFVPLSDVKWPTKST